MKYFDFSRFNILHFSLITFTLLFVISAIDIVHDFEDMGTLNPHVMVEMVMGIISFIALAVVLNSIFHQSRQLDQVNQNLNKTQQALDDATTQALKLRGEFSKLIQHQLTEWQLTPSEKEVALLLLKGLSLEEIAQIRNTKEKTVRQQASNLYKKAAVSGRHELTAFFFEDLLFQAE
ncbi:LuxR C-terminal-related transcriptional regulator [Thiomicrorhabdus sp. 6S3-12]|uniref:helix-turn-helix transcriptional regulator n=1 Tax=Thiomicrorhabdus sp. 6S3-12 TaxID=2819681 RepID=UPI001AAC7210|nr:LuxR C-terminal-related transcriptional regulator [Thiomicrorhabdus sp. 6S3-12]MBO1925069.1 helix-turn-helix transcriptional regulator [Thiomicrorhabdus sp. 6S3-12]